MPFPFHGPSPLAQILENWSRQLAASPIGQKIQERLNPQTFWREIQAAGELPGPPVMTILGKAAAEAAPIVSTAEELAALLPKLKGLIRDRMRAAKLGGRVDPNDLLNDTFIELLESLKAGRPITHAEIRNAAQRVIRRYEPLTAERSLFQTTAEGTEIVNPAVESAARASGVATLSPEAAKQLPKAQQIAAVYEAEKARPVTIPGRRGTGSRRVIPEAAPNIQTKPIDKILQIVDPRVRAIEEARLAAAAGEANAPSLTALADQLGLRDASTAAALAEKGGAGLRGMREMARDNAPLLQLWRDNARKIGTPEALAVGRFLGGGVQQRDLLRKYALPTLEDIARQIQNYKP